VDASGGGREVIADFQLPIVDLIRAVASTPPFGDFHSSEENMAIESSPRIVPTTVMGLRY